jgi:hypothetical protein
MHAINAGDKFGNLIVLREARRRHGKQHYFCKCICGRTTTVNVFNLVRGKTKTCGRRNLIDHPPFKHGEAMRRTPTYVAWSNFIPSSAGIRGRALADILSGFFI